MADSAVKIPFTEAAAPSTPAAGKVVIYAKTDGLLYSKDDAGTETLVSGGAGGGSVATDAIWDAAGDLAVGSGANTAAKLTLGAAGGHVSRINGAVAWDSGTSFPTAATGYRYWRTDLGHQYYYDGTRWLTTEEMDLVIYERVAQGSSGLAATTTVGQAATPSTDMYVTTFHTVMYVATTSSGSQYWTLDLDIRDAANSPTALASVSSVSNTASNWVHETATVNQVVAAATYKSIVLIATKVSTPGNLFFGITSLRYRLIAT